MTAYQIGHLIGTIFTACLIALVFSRYIYPCKDGTTGEKIATVLFIAIAIIATKLLATTP